MPNCSFISCFFPLINVSNREVSRLASKRLIKLQFLTKAKETVRTTTDQSVFYQISPNYLKLLYLSKCLPFLIKPFLFINVDIERALVRNISELRCWRNGNFATIKVNLLEHLTRTY